MKSSDRKLWEKQEKIYRMIEKSFAESPEDERYWKENTDKLLKPTKHYESGWIVD